MRRKRRHNNVFINERIKQFDEKGIQDRPGGSQDARCTRKGLAVSGRIILGGKCQQGFHSKKTLGDIITLIGELPRPGERFKATKEGNQIEIEMPMAINEDGFGTNTLTITDVILIGTQGTAQRLLQDELTGQIYPINNVFISIINNAMVDKDGGEYEVTKPFFNSYRGILWKNNVCKLRAHFRTDDKNIKVLENLKGVDITPEVPEE